MTTEHTRADEPSPFPYEDDNHQLPTRPPVRRPTNPEPYKPHDPGDLATRAVITIWFACSLVAIMAAATREPGSGTIALTAFGIALTATATWAATARADHKADNQ
jgi:hypothetical protein